MHVSITYSGTYVQADMTQALQGICS